MTGIAAAEMTEIERAVASDQPFLSSLGTPERHRAQLLAEVQRLAAAGQRVPELERELARLRATTIPAAAHESALRDAANGCPAHGAEITWLRHLCHVFERQADAKEDARRIYALGLLGLLKGTAKDSDATVNVSELHKAFAALAAKAGRAAGAWAEDPEIKDCGGRDCAHRDVPEHPDYAEAEVGAR
jgi:hypothetical protein